MYLALYCFQELSNSQMMGESETPWFYKAVSDTSMYIYLSHYFWLGMVARIFVSVNVPVVWMGIIIFILSQICMFASYYLLTWLFSLCTCFTCCDEKKDVEEDKAVKEEPKQQEQEMAQLDKQEE